MTATLAEPEPVDLARLKALDAPALRAELTSALGLTSRHLLYLAAVWSELESRGEDLSDLRSGIGVYLPLIATGQVLPDIVVRFAGQSALLRAVAALPLPEQRRLADGNPVPLVVRQGDGYTHRMLPAYALTAAQSRQVFGDRTIRTEAEQIALLTDRPTGPTKPGRSPKRGKFRADRERGVILLGRKPLHPGDLIAALADLQSPQSDELGDDASMVPIKLAPDEHRRFKIKAAESNTTQQTLARNALRAAGLI